MAVIEVVAQARRFGELPEYRQYFVRMEPWGFLTSAPGRRPVPVRRLMVSVPNLEWERGQRRWLS